MQSLRVGLDGVSPLLVDAAYIVGVLVAAVIAERLVIRFLRRAYWRRMDRAAEALGVEELSRIKRQRTLVSLLESLVRYGVYGAATVAVLGVVTDGRATAVFGASLVVLVGFGLQRLLGDVVAGALLLFEGHFAVGDVVTVHQHNVTGTVEEFSLRTTSLRTLGGDRITLMNGAMTSFTRWSYGQREFRLELVAAGGGETVALVASVLAREATAASALWVRAPHVVGSQELDDGRVRVVASIVVAPSHEVLVERLASQLEAELGDRLVGPVTQLPLYGPAYDSWRTGLLVRD